MPVDPELGKSLTLLRTSPDFALTEKADGAMGVTNPPQITPDTGVIWVAAICDLANGQQVDAVLVFDTATGDMPRAVYWWLAQTWLEPAQPDDRDAILNSLNLTENHVFPYGWRTSIPLALG